jgi:spermidine/putrescine transport system ATP-binding protein
MQNIRLENVTKLYDGEAVIENMNLEIPSGKFFALLGPSGSGKSTILRLIAGFEQPDKGSIFLGATDITNVPVNQRKINTVFQNYALFPHMTVSENIAYSLRVAGINKSTIEAKVDSILKRVRLERHARKSIAQLSGGQRQRVALGRAIISEPDVLLLDEPLAALDRKLREHMLLELIELQSTLNTTFIYVTHDQFEALPVADYIAIMNQNGEIEQVASPKEVYEFPASLFVARFVGNTNIFHGTLAITETETGVALKHQVVIPSIGMFSVGLPTRGRGEAKFVHGQEVIVSLRPEKIAIHKTRRTGFANELSGAVRSIVYHGHSTQYNVQLGSGMIMQVFEQNEEHFPQEVIDYYDQVYLYFQKDNMMLLNK